MPASAARWFAGIRLSRTRTLDDAEVRDLRRRLRRLRAGGFLWLLAGPAIVAAGFLLAGLLEALGAPSGAAGGFLLAAVVLGFYVGLAAGLLRVRDGWRLARALDKDLRAGRVEVYEGTRTLDAPDGTAPSGVFEVFPLADVLYRVDGRAREDWPRAYAGVLAEAPAAPVEETLDLDALRALPADSGRHRKRALTDAEREELASYTLEMVRPGRSTRLLLGFAALQWVFFLLALAREGSAVVERHQLQSAMLVVLTAAAAVSFLRRLREKGLLAEDLAAGEVIVTRPPTAEEGTRAVEWLPRSNAVWTDGGVPAAWRIVPKDPEEVSASDD